MPQNNKVKLTQYPSRILDGYSLAGLLINQLEKLEAAKAA